MNYLQDGIIGQYPNPSTLPDVKSGIHFGTEGFFRKLVITAFLGSLLYYLFYLLIIA
jgi:hypothetical protein